MAVQSPQLTHCEMEYTADNQPSAEVWEAMPNLDALNHKINGEQGVAAMQFADMASFVRC